jgi:hypothetical protein
MSNRSTGLAYSYRTASCSALYAFTWSGDSFAATSSRVSGMRKGVVSRSAGLRHSKALLRCSQRRNSRMRLMTSRTWAGLMGFPDRLPMGLFRQ